MNSLPEDPWLGFRRELKKWMAIQEVTASGLAHALGDVVSEDVVHNWRKGASKPRLELLPEIARVLGMGGDSAGEHDPHHLLRAMGLLPHVDMVDAYATAFRVQKLDLRYREAIERNAEAGTERGTFEIVRAVRESKEWAVAVWPAIEGPADCRMHVADRIDLRRLDGGPVSSDDVFQDPTFHSALRLAYAVQSSRNPRWTDDASAETVSKWSISHVGAPASPRRQSPQPGAPSVVCYALSVESWVNDVASLLATAIGYGLTTTRDLAMEVTGIALGSTSEEARREAHKSLQQRPPLRRVWSHHAPHLEDDDPLQIARSDVPVIWVREDDALLNAYTAKWPRADLEQLLAARSRLDELVRAVHPQALILQATRFESPDERWAQVLRHVLEAYTWLASNNYLVADNQRDWADASADDPHVARPLLAWLRNELS